MYEWKWLYVRVYLCLYLCLRMQDATHDQFLSGVLLVLIQGERTQSTRLFTHNWSREKELRTFFKSISVKITQTALFELPLAHKCMITCL